MRKIFGVLGLLAAVALPYPATAAGQTGYLRSEDSWKCVNAYYGIGQPVDYAKAYKCFESQDIYQYRIIMQLNGEGVPPSVDKAKALLEAWQDADPRWAGFADNSRISQILANSAVTKLPPSPKIDFCNDAAQSNYDIGFCIDIQHALDKQDFNKAIATIKAGLTPSEGSLWDQALTAFNAYLDAEGERGMQTYAGGSSSGQAYALQQMYVRQNFLEFMQNTFEKMNLIPSSKDELARAEADMQTAYDGSIASYGESYSIPEKSDAESDSEREFRETMTQNVADYKDDSEASQKSWLALRDHLAQLATQVYKDKKQGVDWAISLKKALTLIRIAEIKNRPLGDDG